MTQTPAPRALVATLLTLWALGALWVLGFGLWLLFA